LPFWWNLHYNEVMEIDQRMKWVLLFLAIFFEVAGTTFMKLSEGFSKPFYSMAIFIFYAGSLMMLTLALKYFEVSTVYAIWSGFGIFFIALIGIFYCGEALNWQKVLFLFLIIFGIVGLNLLGARK
jgi:small multidrug resistance pump